MVTVEKKVPSVVDLVTSEISDFCAVLGEIGAPATPEAIQAALMSRILPLIPAEPLWVGFDLAQGVDDSVPVAWTDKEELRALAEYGCAYIFKIDPANPYTDPRRQIMLCRSQPKSVVVLPKNKMLSGRRKIAGVSYIELDVIITLMQSAGIVVKDGAL